MAKPPMPTITVTKDGPYLVDGRMPVMEMHMEIDEPGDSIGWLPGKHFEPAERFKLCRCGKTLNAPFCDNTHTPSSFDGTETASRDEFDGQVKFFKGPELSLKDAEGFCSSARFCNSKGGVHKLVEATDRPDERAEFLHQAGYCPSGRLVAVENATDTDIEPAALPSIGVVIDTREKRPGPLYLQGRIQVIAVDGFEYEVRDRVTLCRCGLSGNKPFCDGSHSPAH